MTQYLKWKAVSPLTLVARYGLYLGFWATIAAGGPVQAQKDESPGAAASGTVQPAAPSGATTSPAAAPSPVTPVESAPAGASTSAAAAEAKPADASAAASGEASAGTSADAIGFGGAGDAVGFGDSGSSETPSAEPTPTAEHNLSLNTRLTTQEALWTERLEEHALAKARQSLDLDLRYKTGLTGIAAEPVNIRLVAGAHLEYDLAYLVDKSYYDQATIDTYRSQIVGRDTYIAVSYQPVELSFGLQTLNWGQGMILSPLDIANAKDLRENFLVDLENQRIPVLVTRLQLTLGEHRLESAFIHDSYFGLRPAPMSAFSPVRPLIIATVPQIEEVLEGKTLQYRDLPGRFTKRAGQFLERWSYSGAGLDLSVYVGTVLENSGLSTMPPPSEYLKETINLDVWHPRYTTFGHAGATPVGDFALRWELGFDLDRAVNVRDKTSDSLELGIEEHSRINGMLGATYTGITDATLFVEYQQSYLFGDSENSHLEWFFPVEQPQQLAAQFMYRMLQERLSVSAMFVLLGMWDYTGCLVRLEAFYQLRDALTVGLGYIIYQPNDKMSSINGFNNHDQVYASLRWDFLLE
jgi:hypothetical protein